MFSNRVLLEFITNFNTDYPTYLHVTPETDFQEFEEYRVTLDKFYNETGRKDSTSVGRLFQGHCVMVADTGQQENSLVYDGDKNTNFHWNRAKVSRM